MAQLDAGVVPWVLFTKCVVGLTQHKKTLQIYTALTYLVMANPLTTDKKEHTTTIKAKTCIFVLCEENCVILLIFFWFFYCVRNSFARNDRHDYLIKFKLEERRTTLELNNSWRRRLWTLVLYRPRPMPRYDKMQLLLVFRLLLMEMAAVRCGRLIATATASS